MSDQIYKVLALHQARLEGARITVQTDFEEVSEIWADSNQLQEALFHLVQNAEQAMSAERGAGTLTIRVRPAGEGVLGDGVEEVARLLQRFRQEDEPELACSLLVSLQRKRRRITRCEWIASTSE